MHSNNTKKERLLGEKLGTASSKLRKLVMYALAKKLNLDMCSRCGLKIEDVADFSIDHKEPWMAAEDPRTAFYDVSGIAFSHMSCNVGARRVPTECQVRRKIGPTGTAWCGGKCKAFLSCTDFGPDKVHWNGLRGECNKCTAARSRKNYQAAVKRRRG